MEVCENSYNPEVKKHTKEARSKLVISESLRLLEPDPIHYSREVDQLLHVSKLPPTIYQLRCRMNSGAGLGRQFRCTEPQDSHIAIATDRAFARLLHVIQL